MADNIYKSKYSGEEIDVLLDMSLNTSEKLKEKADKSEVDEKLQPIIEKTNLAFNTAENAAYQVFDVIKPSLENKADKETVENKADKTIITDLTDQGTISFYLDFSSQNNRENRLDVADTIDFTFGNGVYPETYTAGLSFDSGTMATMISYTDSGILNWVGTDCAMVDGLSIFQPSANTHYDIVFYFNGKQFIGLVNGYVPSVSR